MFVFPRELLVVVDGGDGVVEDFTVKMLMMFFGAFLLGFVCGYQYAMNEQGGITE